MKFQTNWRLNEPVIQCTKCGRRDGWKSKFVFTVCKNCGHIRNRKDYKKWEKENQL